MKFHSLDGGEDGEPSGFGFAEITKIFTVLDAFCFEMEPFVRVHYTQLHQMVQFQEKYCPVLQIYRILPN